MTLTLSEPTPFHSPDPFKEPTPLRRRLAFAFLAALPLAGVAAVTLQLMNTAAPHTHSVRSAALVPANVPLLRGSLGSGADASLLTLRGETPLAAYAAHRGIDPATVNYSVTTGDTLSSILAEHNVRDEDAQAFLTELRSAGLDSEIKVRPNQAISLNLGGAVSAKDPRPLLGATVRLDAERRIDVSRDPAGVYHAELAHVEMARQEMLARGVITSSLAGDAAEAGVNYSLIAKFAEIYSYDVDFQRDIKPNDTFEIYYARYISPDGQIDPSKSEILFSRLSFNGKVKAYYRFASADGTVDYYDGNGKSARTFLMRTPVEGARISSTFGMRFHPILGYTRMHKGVDFAAPTGTKIFASGAGVVEFAGEKGGYGNYIKIRHDSGYETAYGHMSRFAGGMHSGLRVAQGQVIGFVGATGEATGPHLHYEVLQAGTQINPMSVKVPTGRQLAAGDLERFRRQTEAVDLAMKSNPAAQLAANGIDTGAR